MINFDTLDYSIITPAQMPTETVRDIAEMCGVKTAMMLIEHFGGRLLPIPKNKNDLYDEIYSKCGENAADHIFTVFVGEYLSIPTRKEVLKLIIHQLTINSSLIAYLTHYYGVNRSTIYKWQKERPKSMSRNGISFTSKTIEDFIND